MRWGLARALAQCKGAPSCRVPLKHHLHGPQWVAESHAGVISRGIVTSRALWAKVKSQKYDPAAVMKTNLDAKARMRTEGGYAKKGKNKGKGKGPPPSKPTLAVPHNAAIAAKEVMLIDETGKNRGLTPLPEAIGHARKAGLDLIQVGKVVEGKPLVCRIASAKALLAKQESHKPTGPVQANKTIKAKKLIAQNDLATKIASTKRALLKGHSVCFLVITGNANEAAPILTAVRDGCADVGTPLKWEAYLQEKKVILEPMTAPGKASGGKVKDKKRKGK